MARYYYQLGVVSNYFIHKNIFLTLFEEEKLLVGVSNRYGECAGVFQTSSARGTTSPRVRATRDVSDTVGT